jgi:hypothetical protein
MKIIDLPLKKEWYYMIESGEKREEYREIKPYWIKRFERHKYDAVRFRYGYTEKVMYFNLIEIKRGIGIREWGAPEYPVYILKIGNRIKVQNKDNVR